MKIFSYLLVVSYCFCIALIYSSEFLFITAILSCNSLFWISDNLICSVWIF